MKPQYLHRYFEMDVGHRVMHERVKCANFHGHRYKIDLVYRFTQLQDIGYQIDFKEVKRVVCDFLDTYLDHGFIANPKDAPIIDLIRSTGSKLWLMSLNGSEFCNPSAENVGRELFLISKHLLDSDSLTTHRIRLYETPNCFVDTESVPEEQEAKWLEQRLAQITDWKLQKGSFEYDDRKSTDTKGLDKIEN